MDDYFYELRYINDRDEWRAQIRRSQLHLAWDRFGRRDSQKPVRILDVGCGTGLNMLSFAQSGQVMGVDISPFAVQFCAKRGLLNVAQAAAEYLPFADNSFDLIMLADVLEHISADQDSLANIYRACAPGGLIVIVAPALRVLWSNRDVRLQHKRRYTSSDLKAKIVRAGFTPLKTTYVDTYLLPPLLLLVKLGLLRGPRPALRMDVAPRFGFIDRFWLGLASVERALLNWLDFPAGVSVMSVAKKNIAE